MLAVCLMSLAMIAAAQQQTPDENWAKLNSLATGSEIRVVLVGRKTVRGFLLKASPDALAMNAATGQETLPRQEIARVQLKREGHRGRNTLIGLLVGAGGGLTAGAMIDSRTTDSWFPNVGKVVFTPLGAIIGTVVGVAIPTGGWREVYRVRH